MKRKILTIWYNSQDDIEWNAKNLKPSEMCLLAAIIQEAALKMMGDIEVLSEGENGKKNKHPRAYHILREGD